MTEQEALGLLSKLHTPAHIIEHCKIVRAVAKKIAESYLEKGIEVDIESLLIASLLHDFLRVVDIFNADPEEVQVWASLRRKYPNIDHTEAAYRYLNEIGEKKLALIIKKHRFDAIIDPKDAPNTLEEKILTYADKRVLHNHIVSMKKRFEDGSFRYNPQGENKEWEEKIHLAYAKLEKELFEKIDIKPEDINAGLLN
jgi:HD superfamily phosphodiesterase